jgi:hypothetical protein
MITNRFFPLAAPGARPLWSGQSADGAFKLAWLLYAEDTFCSSTAAAATSVSSEIQFRLQQMIRDVRRDIRGCRLPRLRGIPGPKG